MTARTVVAIVTLLCGLGLVVAIGIIAVSVIRYRAQGPEHPGVQIDTPPLPPAAPLLAPTEPLPRRIPQPAPGPRVAAPSEGRHADGAVDRVPKGYGLSVAAYRRMRSLEETQQMRPVPRADA